MIKYFDCKDIIKEKEDYIYRSIVKHRKELQENKLSIIALDIDRAGMSYINSLRNTFKNYNIENCIDVRLFLSNEMPLDKFENKLQRLELNVNIKGSMFIRPLPKEYEEVANRYFKEKDIECLHNENIGKLLRGYEVPYYPCTPLAIIEILKKQVELKSKKVCIINSSDVIGKPLSMMLLKEKATVTLCNSNTLDLFKVTRNSDIVISAVGVPHFINSHLFYKDNQVWVDVGVSTDEENKLCGDIDIKMIETKLPFIDLSISTIHHNIGKLVSVLMLYQFLQKLDSNI